MSFSLRHFEAPQEHFVPGRQQLFGGVRVPGVGAFALEEGKHVAQRLKILELLAARIRK